MRSLRRLCNAIIPEPISRRLAARRLRNDHGVYVSPWDAFYDIRNTTFGSHCRLAGPLHLSDSVVGDYSYVEPNCRISSCDIGKFCAIAPHCIVGPLSHPADRVSTHPAFYLRAERFAYRFVDESADPSADQRTHIGNDVWLGAQVFVKRGVRIGDGAIVGAGAVVTRDVPDYGIVAGVPARLIRSRFDEKTAQRLRATRWWDLDEQALREAAAYIPDVQGFLTWYENRA